MGRALGDFALSAGTGLILPFAYRPYHFAWLAWVALVPLGLAMRRRPSPESLIGAYLGGLIFQLVAMDWVRTCYGGTGLNGPRALAWLVSGAYLALLWPLILVVGSRLCWPSVLALPIVWTSYELLRQLSTVPLCGTTWPWLQFGAVHDNLLIQIADIAGVAGVAVVIAAVNGALVDVITGRGKRDVAYLIGAVALVLASLTYGAYCVRYEPTAGPTVCLMHTSTEPAVNADIYLWSEVAFRRIVTTPEDFGDVVKWAKRDSVFVIGCRRQEQDRLFNDSASFLL